MEKTAGVHQKGTFSLNDALELLRQNPEFKRVGAVAMFVGVVRGMAKGKAAAVEWLWLEAYEEKADEVLEGICKRLKKKSGVVDVQIHHLLGEFTVGEELVYVLVAGEHRADVFGVLAEAVEGYKREAPIFKKEQTRSKQGKRTAYWTSEHKEGL